jgi:hypothetical protein
VEDDVGEQSHSKVPNLLRQITRGIRKMIVTTRKSLRIGRHQISSLEKDIRASENSESITEKVQVNRRSGFIFIRHEAVNLEAATKSRQAEESE